MTESDEICCVQVRQNLVVAIRKIQRAEAKDATIHDDRLSVSTELAQNNLANGCFDGDYFLEDFDAARHFAALCFGYMKSLCEKSIEAVNEADRLKPGHWVNPNVPGSHRDS